MTTITYAGGPVLAPMRTSIATAAASAEPGTVVHQILDGPPVFTLRAASPSRGRLELVFATETAAADCFSAHLLPAVFTIADATRAMLNFRYVVAGGEPEMRLDETAAHWVVTVPWQRVI